jgi:hypothetical protein
MGKDYYSVLGVPKGTSDENELKKGKSLENIYTMHHLCIFNGSIEHIR